MVTGIAVRRKKEMTNRSVQNSVTVTHHISYHTHKRVSGSFFLPFLPSGRGESERVKNKKKIRKKTPPKPNLT